LFTRKKKYTLWVDIDKADFVAGFSGAYKNQNKRPKNIFTRAKDKNNYLTI